MTPLAALNTFRDLHEGFEHALSRVKQSPMRVWFKRRADEDGEEENGGEPEEETLDLLGDGPNVAELGMDEEIGVLESKQPSSEFQQFTQTMTAVSLKALDLPLVFYDESHTNFFGSKAALTLYLQEGRSQSRPGCWTC